MPVIGGKEFLHFSIAAWYSASVNAEAPEPNDELISGFHHRDHLPHLKQEGGAYFVTFRLAGSLPSDVIRELKLERERLVSKAQSAARPLTWFERDQLFRWYSTKVDRYLDAGHGEPLLKNKEIAKVVSDAVRFHAGQRFELYAWVIMPNHVHAVVWPLPGWSLSQILKSWKGFTARQINLVLKREGSLWQSESYDHLIRDDADCQRCCLYTIMNPVDAGLCASPEDWPWSNAFNFKRVRASS